MSAASRPSPLETNSRARRLLPVFLLLLVGLTVWHYAKAPAKQIHIFSGSTMGTTYTVKIAADGLDPELSSAIAAVIERRLQRVNSLMSTYDPESELSRFNASPAGVPFTVSPETLAVFQRAKEISELSGGAFDVTVGPIVEAWGFGASEPDHRPTEEQLAGLRDRVGFRRIRIDAATSSLTKLHDAITCDLSALAKGYGVDQVAEALLVLGQHDFLVEVGGELRAAGHKTDGSEWKIAIEKPNANAREIYRVVHLGDLSMATSGDYRNFFEENEKRYSHTIDPRTARPIEHALASVTVFHAQAMSADALATALNVLGPEKGLALATEQDLAVLFIVRRDDGTLDSLMTPAFEALGGSVDAPPE